jgi:VRR-NUC domain
MSTRYTEFQSCVALATWWTFYARINKFYEGLLFHIPNQSPGGIKYRANNKRMGVRAGTPDYLLAIPRHEFHGMFIEMKSADGRLSPEQLLAQAKLKEQQYRVITCYSTGSASVAIEQYLQ